MCALSLKVDFPFCCMESFIAELSAYLTVSGFDNYELSNEELEVFHRFDKLKNDDWKIFIVNKLIERVEIHNNEKKHAHGHVKVDIYFTTVGLFDIPTEQQLIETMESVKEKNVEKSA